MVGLAPAWFFVCIFSSNETVIENKAAASNCFLDQFYLCSSWIDTKTVGFMDEHRYSPSLNGNVRSIISYRDELYNVCKKQVIVWYLCSNYYYFNGLSNSQTTEIAKAIPCLKAIHLPLTAGLCPLRAGSESFLASF